MKTWALFAFFCFFMGTVTTLNGRPDDRSTYPHVITQRATADGGRSIVVHNPLNKAIWMTFECKNVMVVTPVGMPGRTTDAVVLHATEGGEVIPIEDAPCFMTKWWVQGKGGSVND